MEIKTSLEIEQQNNISKDLPSQLDKKWVSAEDHDASIKALYNEFRDFIVGVQYSHKDYKEIFKRYLTEA